MATDTKITSARALAHALAKRESTVSDSDVDTLTEQELYGLLEEFDYAWDGGAWVPVPYLA